MHCTAEGLLEELHSLVQEELKVVSYKWLARQYQIPSNQAKQVLRQYMQQHGSQAKAIFLVAGQPKADPACLVTRLVDSTSLTACLEEFITKPSVHIHSVMPAEPHPVTDAGRLWAEDVLQARHFYYSVLQQQQAADSSADVFARNTCSSVKFDVNIATPQGKQRQQQQQQQQQQQRSPQVQRDQGTHAARSGSADGLAAEDELAAAAASGGDADQPATKRQKLPTGAAAAATAGGAFRIDPETGEEVWEEEPTQQPAAADVAADAGTGDAAAAPTAAPQPAEEQLLSKSVPPTAATAGGAGAAGKSSAAAGAGKSSAAGSKAGGSKAAGKGGKGGGAGQRNIMSFFGKQ